MELVVLGSGGSTTIPRPGCRCEICLEAARKGIPYSRSGPSMFIRGSNVLFDAPEEIASQIIREGIIDVNCVFLTHWHPDHTFGMRIVERMYKFWLDMFVKGRQPLRRVKVCALDEVMDDLASMGYRGGEFLRYYERSGLIEPISLRNGDGFEFMQLTVTPFRAHSTYGVSTAFLIEEKGKRMVYAPCDVKPFPKASELIDLDLLIIGSFHLEGALKGGIVIPPQNPLRAELFSPSEIQGLAEKLDAKRTIVTHIEEEWGKSYDEYKQLECELGVEFAFDGMRITL